MYGSLIEKPVGSAKLDPLQALSLVTAEREHRDEPSEATEVAGTADVVETDAADEGQVDSPQDELSVAESPAVELDPADSNASTEQPVQAMARLLEVAAKNADDLLAEATAEADRVTQEAREEAERVVRKAREEADQLRKDLEKTRSSSTKEIARLRQLESDSRERIRAQFNEGLAALELPAAG